MPVGGLPVAAEITLDVLLQKNAVFSWKVTGNRNDNTVFLLRLTALSSDITRQQVESNNSTGTSVSCSDDDYSHTDDRENALSLSLSL